MKTLLPPNATRFQRDLELVNGFRFDENQAIQTLINVKSDPPDNFLYWLIWEYGLDEILPYISDPRTLIADGLKWQRLRGTPKSLRIALGWVNVYPVRIEEEPPGAAFFQYQLELDRILRSEELKKTLKLCDLSAPVRSRLARIYNKEHDIRPLHLSEDTFGAYLSDYSGVHHKGVRLSFGRNHLVTLKVSPPVTSGSRGRTRYTETKAAIIPLLGRMKIEDRAMLNHLAVHGRLHLSHFASPDGNPIGMNRKDWYGSWGNRDWKTGEIGQTFALRNRQHSSRFEYSGPSAIHIHGRREP